MHLWCSVSIHAGTQGLPGADGEQECQEEGEIIEESCDHHKSRYNDVLSRDLSRDL